MRYELVDATRDVGRRRFWLAVGGGLAILTALQANGGPPGDCDITQTVAYLPTLQGVSDVPPAPAEEEETLEPTPAPWAPPARPSNPGAAGPATSLTGAAGSDQPLFGLYYAACHGPQGVMGLPNQRTVGGRL